MKELLNEWKNYLKESKREYVVTFEQLESIFKVFHLSRYLLPNSEEKGNFTFTPRVPISPMDGEDNFTNRISLAPKINRAIYALDFYKKSNAYKAQNYHVYAGDLKHDYTDDIDTVKLNVELRRCSKDLYYFDKHGKKIRFGSSPDHFWVSHYADRIAKEKFNVDNCDDLTDKNQKEICRKIKSAETPSDFGAEGFQEIQQKFYACVPDAAVSREEWSLKPVSLYYIGEKVMGENKVIVSERMWNQLQNILKKSTKKIKAKVYDDPEIFEGQKEPLNEWKKFVIEANKKVVPVKKVEPKKPKPPGIYSNTYTENAVNIIKKFEQFKSTPYQNKGDKPTIGFGTTEYVSSDGKTRKPVTMKDAYEISEDLADDYIRNYLNFVVMPSLNNYLRKRNLNRNQIDALVSIMYNKGNTAFLNSPIFTAVNKNPKDPNLQKIFLADAAGKDPGILARRKEEWKLYSS